MEAGAINDRLAGKFIRSARLKLGLTQKQAGEIFGGGVNAFSRYERGITRPPRSLLALLRILEANPELLSRCLF